MQNRPRKSAYHPFVRTHTHRTLHIASRIVSQSYPIITIAHAHACKSLDGLSQLQYLLYLSLYLSPSVSLAVVLLLSCCTLLVVVYALLTLSTNHLATPCRSRMLLFLYRVDSVLIAQRAGHSSPRQVCSESESVMQTQNPALFCRPLANGPPFSQGNVKRYEGAGPLGPRSSWTIQAPISVVTARGQGTRQPT